MRATPVPLGQEGTYAYVCYIGVQNARFRRRGARFRKTLLNDRFRPRITRVIGVYVFLFVGTKERPLLLKPYLVGKSSVKAAAVLVRT